MRAESAWGDAALEAGYSETAANPEATTDSEDSGAYHSETNTLEGPKKVVRVVKQDVTNTEMKDADTK